MKMANIEAAFDFMFTNPKNEHGVRMFKVFSIVFLNICIFLLLFLVVVFRPVLLFHCE